ncbi:MAG: GlxA family transcriptional regulator [Pseudomonadota bacterium]
MQSKSRTGTPSPSEVTTRRVGFFLTPGFAPLGFFAALEVLRTANRFLNQAFYGWHVYSADGSPVKASNGVSVIADQSIAEADYLDSVFVCAGFEPEKSADAKTLAWLRRLYRYGVGLGAISTGTCILARAGVIKDRKCTVHFDQAASLREEFPEIDLVDGVFENDRGLSTCAGGTSAIDLFVYIVSQDHGEQIASGIAHQFLQDRVRNAQEIQSKSKHLAVRVKSERLFNAMKLMEQNIEEPLSSLEVAEAVGLSERQLQRLFREHTGRTTNDYYVNLRLQHSQLLLLQTSMPIVQIALASGFATPSHFSKRYRDRFGYSPRLERKRAL